MNEHSAQTGWSRLAEGITFALDIHARQTRKGVETPYISHLLGVSSLVLEHGGDEEQAIAAMLHDAIEDQGAHQDAEIQKRFGARVAAIVRACTDTDIVPKPPWRARKAAYIDHLETADPDALLVSCADKLHNARAICTDLRTHGLSVYDRFTGGREGTLWYYKSLADAFQRLTPSPLAHGLGEAVTAMERLAAEMAVPNHKPAPERPRVGLDPTFDGNRLRFSLRVSTKTQ